MELPDADRARVDRVKIVNYLLCESHPDGGSKARFFARFGFTVSHWEALAEALREHARANPVIFVVESVYGTRYTVEGPLVAPDGRTPIVRSVWMVKEPEPTPRLITAFPS